MKRVLALVLVVVMVMAMSACDKGGDSGSGGSGGTTSTTKADNGGGTTIATKTDNGGSTTQAASTGTSPRVTYYDGKDGKKYAASLQNAHLKYEYGEDRSDGKGVVSYTFEFLNCEDYHYHCRYTVVGYDEARKGILSEPDEHVAILYEDGKYILYDFYRKMIVDDYPLSVVNEDKTFLPEGLGSATFNIYRATEKFEDETNSRGKTDTFCEREEISPITSLCAAPKGYELKKRIVTHGKVDRVSQMTSKKFFYDTETEIGLYAEFYLDNDPKARIDEGAGESYYEYTSSLSSRVEVTLYEVGKVTPSDVKAKVSELMSGHESDYKHVTFDEYSKIFE